MKVLVSALLLLSPLHAAAMQETPALKQAFDKAGVILGLKLTAGGAVRWDRVNPQTGVAYASTLSPAAAERVARFLLKLDLNEPEASLAKALEAYLSARLKPADEGFKQFVVKGEGGKARLTALGRNALMDVLTAEDGQLLDKPSKNAASAQPGGPMEPKLPLDTRKLGAETGSLSAAGRAAANAGSFDGSASLHVAAFDWGALARETSSRAGLRDVGPSVLDGYTVDREANVVRVLIAANRAVKEDRFKVENAQQASQVILEAGLDEKMLAARGAKVVRAVDNLVAVDVPVPQAAKLGADLGKRGLRSAPARLFRRISVAASESPAAAMLGGQFSPIPTAALAQVAAEQADGFDPQKKLGVDQMWKAGMDGKGAVVGIIDSGMDETHPDLKDRVVEYKDFTDEGNKDVVGHGTHVAGTVAGSGAASDGKYKGMAPGAKLIIAKVFGTKGEASEDIILSAMKWMSKEKPDVVNMSLGGPGEPNVDPLGSMANRMMIKDNILLVAAAGNEGPSAGTVGAPGNARYVLTVTGVNKEGAFSFFPSRGPVEGPDGYAKPDIAAIAGDINVQPPTSLFAQLTQQNGQGNSALASAGALAQGGAGLKSLGGPAEGNCIYGPGVISTRSKDDPDKGCAVVGNPNYRYMTGTSMATPMIAGVGADVIGYLKSQGVTARSSEVKAVMQETASDLGQPREVEGAGLVNGGSLAKAVAQRAAQGLPIGNIAYALALRLTSNDRQALAKQSRYKETALGLLDTRTDHLVNTDAEFDGAVKIIRKVEPAPAPQAPVSAPKFPSLPVPGPAPVGPPHPGSGSPLPAPMPVPVG
ncbi:MAG: S8 family serine peptidase [Elusimicrobia bacterium]|nr:S8 family serine peptidase [Elusimicrobiota bacterium]